MNYWKWLSLIFAVAWLVTAGVENQTEAALTEWLKSLCLALCGFASFLDEVQKDLKL